MTIPRRVEEIGTGSDINDQPDNDIEKNVKFEKPNARLGSMRCSV